MAFFRFSTWASWYPPGDLCRSSSPKKVVAAWVKWSSNCWMMVQAVSTIIWLCLIYLGHHLSRDSSTTSANSTGIHFGGIVRKPGANSTHPSSAPEMVTPRPGGGKVAYYDGQTIATVDYSQSGNITACNLIEVSREAEASAILDELGRSYPVQGVGLRQMLEIITACKDSDDLPRRIYRTPGSVWSMLNGILPGTKWCGLGDIARSYDDLGPETDMDKCCRAHDHCPTKIKGFKKRYGLTNWSFYTKSHCDCDDELYQCLKKVGSSLSTVLGNFYFNMVRIQCLVEDYPQRCVSGNGLSCVWERDYTQPKKMQFKNVDRKF